MVVQSKEAITNCPTCPYGQAATGNREYCKKNKGLPQYGGYSIKKIRFLY